MEQKERHTAKNGGVELLCGQRREKGGGQGIEALIYTTGATRPWRKRMDVIDEDTYIIYKRLVVEGNREIENLLERLAGEEGEEARLLQARVNVKRKVVAQMEEEITEYEEQKGEGTPGGQ
jgi:hypothetical protein